MNRILITISLLFIASCSGSTSVDSPADPPATEEPVLITDSETVGGSEAGGGLDVDWEAVPVLSEDPANDQLGEGPDLGDLKAFYDDEYLYIQVEIIKPGYVKQFDIAVMDAEERLFWVIYYPEDGRLELSRPRIGREEIEGEVFYGQHLEIKLPMNLFTFPTLLDQDQPIREASVVRAMISSLEAGDEVSGGIIPNQSGDFEFARHIDPYEILKATTEARYESSGAAQYENSNADELFYHENAIRFISYNIQFGGLGIDNFENGGSLEDGRLPIIAEIIEKYNPDILALQELTGWDAGNPMLADQLAERLGMDYVYCTSAQSFFDTAIYSKYPIVESNLFPDVRRCFIHIAVEAPGGEILHIFANHGYFDDELGCNAPMLQKMIDISAPFMDGLAILMGDLNISNMVGFVDTAIPEEVCYQMLSDAGWEIAKFQNVDQIYISNSLQNYVGYPVNTIDDETLDVPSSGVGADHAPLVWDLYLQ
jgi:endonuclease/exonuclease/phosphatase family metal-dependent hydrolase